MYASDQCRKGCHLPLPNLPFLVRCWHSPGYFPACLTPLISPVHRRMWRPLLPAHDARIQPETRGLLRPARQILPQRLLVFLEAMPPSCQPSGRVLRIVFDPPEDLDSLLSRSHDPKVGEQGSGVYHVTDGLGLTNSHLHRGSGYW